MTAPTQAPGRPVAVTTPEDIWAMGVADAALLTPNPVIITGRVVPATAAWLRQQDEQNGGAR